MAVGISATEFDNGPSSTTLRVQRTRFVGGTIASASSTPGLGVSFGAFVAVQNCTFEDMEGYPDISNTQGTVGLDSPARYNMSTKGQPAVPLGQLPNNVTYLTADHADLLAIKRVRTHAWQRRHLQAGACE